MRLLARGGFNSGESDPLRPRIFQTALAVAMNVGQYFERVGETTLGQHFVRNGYMVADALQGNAESLPFPRLP